MKGLGVMCSMLIVFFSIYMRFAFQSNFMLDVTNWSEAG
jgi:hypothetical protein